MLTYIDTLTVHTDKSVNGISGDDVILVKMQSNKIETWIPVLREQRFRRRRELFLEFEAYPYIDDIYMNSHLKKRFDKFFVDYMENSQIGKIFVNFVFRIRSRSFDELENCGFIEWLYYSLLIFKGTHCNISLVVDYDCLSNKEQPIECRIARDMADPRLNICLHDNILCADKKKVIPEDIGYYTTLIKVSERNNGEFMAHKFGIKNSYVCGKENQ